MDFLSGKLFILEKKCDRRGGDGGNSGCGVGKVRTDEDVFGDGGVGSGADGCDDGGVGGDGSGKEGCEDGGVGSEDGAESAVVPERVASVGRGQISEELERKVAMLVCLQILAHEDNSKLLSEYGESRLS